MTSLRTGQRIESALGRGLFGLPAAALRLLAGPPVVADGATLDVQCQLLLRLARLRGADTVDRGGIGPERDKLESGSRVFEPRAGGAIDTRALRLAGGAGDIAGRLYRPPGCLSGSPALVFYHGGGFVLGSLDSHDGICRALAHRGDCVVIAVDYRLAPEHPAPAAAADAVAAFRDIARRADEYGIDPARIALAGDSAGANLAAVVAQQTRTDASPPCFQLLFYPGVDFASERESARTFGAGFLLDQATMAWFRKHYIPADMDFADPRVSPIYGELDGVAPALIVVAGFDPLRDEGQAYAQALRAAGVAVEIRLAPELIHGFLNFAGAVTRADEALSEAAQRLASALAKN